MPVNAGDGGPYGFLEVLGDVPVVLALEVADGDDAGAGAHGEFRLRRGPSHCRGGTIDAQDHKGGHPGAVWAGGWIPDVCVAVYQVSSG